MADLQQGEIAHADDEIISECRERFGYAQEASGVNRSGFIADKRFLFGEQWDPKTMDSRTQDNRPALTINITDAICRRVKNSCRENRPRIKVHPVGEGADVQTAEIIDGLIRHIEDVSNAPYAYDTAVENAVDGGWGWLALDHDYVSDDSFDQDLKLGAYPNPLVCYGDPTSHQPDGSDMEWFVETELIKRTIYKAKYGYLDESGWQWLGDGDNIPNWSNKEEIRIAKYWRVERKQDTVLRLNDGSSILKSRLKPEHMQMLQLNTATTRTVYRRQIRCYLLNAFRILDARDWPGQWIPRVPVYGRRQDLNGEMKLKGMVRDLQDPARMYNYSQSAKTEQYALQPKAPWLVAAGQIEGLESTWRDANRKPFPYLEYKPVRLEDGTYAPPPERQAPPQPNAGFAEWGESTKSDFLLVAGMPHDPDVDKKGEVVSGIALRKRQGLADVSNFDFYDNLVRSIRHLGRIIIDVIPYFYDTKRTIRIIREDGTPEMVQINAPQVEKTLNDLTRGQYAVMVDTGPSYQTKREESAEALLELLGTPLGEMVAHAAGDKVVRAMDFANSGDIADRLMALIPAAQMENMPDLPPKARAIIAGLRAQLQQAGQVINAQGQEIKTKQGIEQMKQAGETERKHIEAHVRMRDTDVKATTAMNVAEINAAATLIDTGQQAAHEHALADKTAAAAERAMGFEAAHSSMEAERDRQHMSQEAERGRQHESHEAEAGRKHESSEGAKDRAKPRPPG